RKRGRARSHGGAPEGAAGASRPSPRDRRTSFRFDQAMDEPGSLPHARPRKSARRVQPDGARLQSASGTQHSRHGKADGGGSGVKTPQIALDRTARPASGRSRKPKRDQEPILAGNGE